MSVIINEPLSPSEHHIRDTDGEHEHISAKPRFQNMRKRLPKFGINTALRIAALAYFNVSGGPFSIELAVKAWGPFPTLIGIPIILVVWCLPLIHMTIELAATTPDEDGGYVIWVADAFGPYYGWVNSLLNLVSNTLDLCMYPVLVTDYIGLKDFWIRAAVQLTVTLFAAWVNLKGIEAVGWSQIAMSILILTPVAILCGYGFQELNAKDLGTTLPNPDYSLFASTFIWNFVGFSAAGCVTESVSGSRDDYMRGLAVAAIGIGLTYGAPVLATVVLVKDYSSYHAGTFVTAGHVISVWLGYSMTVSAVMSAIAQLVTILTLDARASWATARLGVLPEFLAQRNDKLVPVNAIWFHTILTVGLSLVDLELVINACAMCTCAGLLFQAAVLVKTVRNYRTKATCAALTCVIGVVTYFGEWYSWATVAAIFLFGTIHYYVYGRNMCGLLDIMNKNRAAKLESIEHLDSVLNIEHAQNTGTSSSTPTSASTPSASTSTPATASASGLASAVISVNPAAGDSSDTHHHLHESSFSYGSTAIGIGSLTSLPALLRRRDGEEGDGGSGVAHQDIGVGVGVGEGEESREEEQIPLLDARERELERERANEEGRGETPTQVQADATAIGFL